jgi:hypothetical protein
MQVSKGLQGIQGVQGPQGPVGPSVGGAVFSANDEYMGIPEGNGTVFVPSINRFFSLNTETGVSDYPATLWYVSPDCQGTPYHHSVSQGDFYRILRNHNHFTVTPGTTVSIFKAYGTRNLTFPYACEVTDSNCNECMPVTEVILPFTYPVPLPLRYEY